MSSSSSSTPTPKRNFSRYEWGQLYHAMDDGDFEPELIEQLRKRVPPSDEHHLADMAVDTPRQLLEPQENAFSAWEVWVNSNEPSAAETVRQTSCCGSRARQVPGSTMTIGDFWVVREGCQVMTIVERKTMEDLLRSLHSGHLDDQLERMTISGAPTLIVLVVGSLLQVANEEDRQAMQTKISSMNDLHRALRVEFASDDTAVARMLHNYCVNARGNFEGTEHVHKIPTVEAVKRECAAKQVITQPVTWRLQLALIHGMSNARALAVTERYPTALRYLDAVRQCFNRRAACELLSEIPVELSSKSKRRGFRNLGPALSKRIFECMVGAQDVADHPDERWVK